MISSVCRVSRQESLSRRAYLPGEVSYKHKGFLAVLDYCSRRHHDCRTSCDVVTVMVAYIWGFSLCCGFASTTRTLSVSVVGSTASEMLSIAP